MTLDKFLWGRYGDRVDAKFISDLSGMLQSMNGSPVEIDKIAPEAHGEFSFCAVRFAEALPELRRLHILHWDETEQHSKSIPLNPDYKLYEHLDMCGRMLTFVVVHEGRIVGNCMMKLNPSLHTQRLTASEDTLFLMKEFRGRKVALAFVKYVEKVLKDLGCTEIRVSSKLINGADKFMVRAGFKPIATQLIKMLE